MGIFQRLGSILSLLYFILQNSKNVTLFPGILKGTPLFI